MDPDFVATMLWIAFGIALVLGVAGVWRRGSSGLGMTALASAVLLVFSFLGGFSIGPFTVAIPMVLTALAVTGGTQWRALTVVVAAIAYFLLVWVLPQLVRGLGLEGGIIAVAISCGLAYLVAATAQPVAADPPPPDRGR